MGRLAPELIEQIAAANDIVEVIGGYFPLKRAGSAYRALCPFHQERTPSFQVNPHKQIFKCFGCGAGGSVFRFVMDYEHVDFVTAAKKLADRAGIRIVEQELSPEDQRRYDMRRRLLALHAEAAEFFHFQLMRKPAAQKARDYLKGRGISTEIAKSWKLGYAPDEWDAMRGFAQRGGFSDEELLASGLVKEREEDSDNSQFYDRFRDRVMFPICNDTGEVIAFSGRVLEADAKAAKYVNSPETALFTKGAVLFGLHRSKRALIEKQSAIVCEGQLDLITAFEAGVQNVIAPQGTAFTDKQAGILQRYVKEVILCFDSDRAGEKAADRSIEALVKNGLLVRIAAIPAGEDPDSIIRGRGAMAFAEVIECAREFFSYKLDVLARQLDLTTIRGKRDAGEILAPLVRSIKDGLYKESAIGYVSRALEFSTAEFEKLVNKGGPSPGDKLPSEFSTPTEKTFGAIFAEQAKRVEHARQSSDEERQQRLANSSYPSEPVFRLLALVALRDPAARAWILAENWQRLLGNDPDAGLVVKVLSGYLNPDDPASVSAFLATLSAQEEAAISAMLEERLPEHPMPIAHDCWNELERRQIRRRMEALQARLRAPDLPMETIVMLQKEVLDLQKRLSDIARPFSPPL